MALEGYHHGGQQPSLPTWVSGDDLSCVLDDLNQIWKVLPYIDAHDMPTLIYHKSKPLPVGIFTSPIGFGCPKNPRIFSGIVVGWPARLV